MIIDCILDRKDNEEYHGHDFYRAKEFYLDVLQYGRTGDSITRAMDFGTENDVKVALCEYIIRNEYNPAICAYVCSKQWL